MKTRVALNCGNMQSNDPHYTYLGDVVNEAANAVILMAVAGERKNLNSFQRLRNRRYYDTTVNAQGYLTKPDDILVVDSVTYTKSTSAYDPSRHREYSIYEETDQERFGLLDKASTRVGYPQIWCEASTQVLLWPTPTTAYLTQIVLRGIKKEAALANANDTFDMEDIWHPVVIQYATYLMMQNLGWDDADKWLARAEKRVTQIVDLLGLSNRRDRFRWEVAGAL